MPPHNQRHVIRMKDKLCHLCASACVRADLWSRVSCVIQLVYFRMARPFVWVLLSVVLRTALDKLISRIHGHHWKKLLDRIGSPIRKIQREKNKTKIALKEKERKNKTGLCNESCKTNHATKPPGLPAEGFGGDLGVPLELII